MKFFSPRFIVLLCASFAAATVSPALPTPAKITYTPPAATVQGNQPLNKSYVLTVTGPANLAAGSSVNVALGLSVLSMPTGQNNATALSFISVSPSTLTFTGPNQQKTTTVTVVVPLGNNAGDYAYKITTSGWPAALGTITDGGATVNAYISPPGTIDTTPPAILLLSPADGTVYTYAPATGNPVTVPVSLSASVGTNGQPIDSMVANINNVPVVLTVLGYGTSSASATGSVPFITPGLYTVNALATNQNGTSRASANISVVVSAPPPTIMTTSPASNSAFNFVMGGPGASVPVSFTANSIYGNITALSATLDGSPIMLSLSGVGSALTATASALLTVAQGTHSLVFSSSNAYGNAAPVTVPFSVTGIMPPPTVSILTPATGATYARVSGDPATVVNLTFQGSTAYGAVTSATVKLDGVQVPATVVGLYTPSITGSSSLNFTSGGVHTINVMLSNGGATASASTSFNVTQTQPPSSTILTWLPPIVLNKTINGGSTMPIKFRLDVQGQFVRDTSVYLAIYEVFANGSISAITTYPYGTGSPNPPDYAIAGKMYHLNFKTAKGVHNYRIDVYSTAAGLPPQLLGTKDLFTKVKSSSGGDGHEDDDDDECDGND